MNLPEYRRVCRMAQERFRAAVYEASEGLAKDMAAADEQFFEDEDRVAERVERVEHVELKRLR